MQSNIEINPNTWVDIEALDTDATNEEIIEQINLITDHLNLVIKNQLGIS